MLGDEPPALQLMADTEIELGEMTMSLAQALERMEPFGVANPVPQFILQNMTITRIIPLGGAKHTKLLLAKDGKTVTAVYFGIAPTQLHFVVNERVDVLFQLSINEFQGERSLQMIVQDIRPAVSYADEQKNQRDRYEELRSGATYDEAEEPMVVPTREDFAVVYTYLRREFRQGNHVMPERALLAALESMEGVRINYIKLKFILRVLEELNICGVTELEHGFYMFDIYFTASKTSIDKSSILRKLKSQCRRG